MSDFSAYTGWAISEGNVVQVTDASGVVLWAASGGKVILQVEKITSSTYAGETIYENEQFILLDIYPKTNGTVTVTYGGLTKTITDTSGAVSPNAQQVVFGTFNGVTHDSTPASGELTIEGDYYAYGCGGYAAAKAGDDICACITNIVNFGAVEQIPEGAFACCEKLTEVIIPNGVTKIVGTALGLGRGAFFGCSGLKSITFPNSLVEIGFSVFSGCTSLASAHFQNQSNWYVFANELAPDDTTAVDVSDAANNATLLTDTYCAYGWKRT